MTDVWGILSEPWGVLIGAGITGLAGLAGHAWQVNREHRQWLRNEKQKAYFEFITETSAIYKGVGRSTKAEHIYELERLNTNRSKIKLLGSPEVQNAARALDTALSDLLDMRLRVTQFESEDAGQSTGDSALREEVDQTKVTAGCRFDEFVSAARRDLRAAHKGDGSIIKGSNNLDSTSSGERRRQVQESD